MTNILDIELNVESLQSWDRIKVGRNLAKIDEMIVISLFQQRHFERRKTTHSKLGRGHLILSDDDSHWRLVTRPGPNLSTIRQGLRISNNCASMKRFPTLKPTTEVKQTHEITSSSTKVDKVVVGGGGRRLTSSGD